MVKRQKRPNSGAGKLIQVEAQFKAISKLVSAWVALEERAGQSLYFALGTLLTFGEDLRDDSALLEAFLVGKGMPFGKVSQENPYNGLVKLAFPRVSEASHSKYGRVLQFAHDTKPRDEEFVTWLSLVKDKLDGRYAEAVAYYRSSSPELRASVRREHLLRTKERLASRALTSPMLLTGADPGNGYKTALIRVLERAATIVDVFEEDEEQIDQHLLRQYPVPKTIPDVLLMRPLGGLYQALNLVTAATPAQTSSHERVVVIANRRRAGHRLCEVQNASFAYTFSVAIVELDKHVEGLELDLGYVLDEAGAQTFMKKFAGGDEEWSIKPVQGSRDRNLVAPGQTVTMRALAGDGLRTACQASRQTKHFRLTSNRAEAFIDFVQSVTRDFTKRNKARKEPIQKPKCLTATSLDRELVVSLDGLRSFEMDLLQLNAPGALVPERWLSLEDMTRISTLLQKRGLNAQGWFADMEEADAAVCVKAKERGAVVVIIVPMWKSRNGDLAQTCCPLI